MKPSTSLKIHREQVIKAALARRACNVRVFGSVLSGTDTDGSDLDLLVDTLPGATLFELGGLQVDLEELLGVPVDLLTPGDLPAKFRDRILDEAKQI
jgi:predicted nucleotidyltransferase